MSDLRSKMIRLAASLSKGDPKRREILASLRTAGGTSMGVFGSKQEALVGPRQILKLCKGAASSIGEDLNEFDFKHIEWKDEKDAYGRPQVVWRVFRKGSFGDRDEGYIYGYVKATVMASSKGGAYIECRVQVVH
jgi:hypothetical protein